MMVVVDGTRQTPYNSVFEDHAFSPDSTKLAYAARNGRNCFLVIDGRERRSYEHLMGRALTWTDNGTVVYCAVRNKQKVVVAGDEEGKLYDDVIAGPKGILVSPRIRYIGLLGDRVYAVEEDLPAVGAID
jgi:hypothetical protein